MPLSASDRRTRDHFIRLFGCERFTIRDLWRDWAGRPRWPTQDFTAEMEGELARLPFVEPAPGPRGGQGWRVMPAVVADLERDRADHAAWIHGQNQPHKAAAEALESRYAEITVCEDTQRVRVAYPNLELAPRWIGMRFQEITVGAIVADWSRRHRYKGIDVSQVSASLSCDWQHAKKMSTVLAKLDELVGGHIEAAAKYHADRLAELERYRPSHAAAE